MKPIKINPLLISAAEKQTEKTQKKRVEDIEVNPQQYKRILARREWRKRFRKEVNIISVKISAKHIDKQFSKNFKKIYPMHSKDTAKRRTLSSFRHREDSGMFGTGSTKTVEMNEALLSKSPLPETPQD